MQKTRYAYFIYPSPARLRAAVPDDLSHKGRGERFCHFRDLSCEALGRSREGGKDTERGGFILPFLLVLLITLPLFFFLVDFAQSRLITQRMTRVAKNPEAQKWLLTQGILGITKAKIQGDKLSVTYTPFMPSKGSEITLNQNIFASQPLHLVVALDVFIPQGEGDIHTEYAPLFKALETFVGQGHTLTLIPYAASINLGANYPVIFPPAPPQKRLPVEFLTAKPQKAITMNAKGQYIFGQNPIPKLWTGCISLKKRCDFDAAEPFFVPSTFGRQPASFKNQLYEGLMVLGSNNWTERTITEERTDRGGFVQGPNIGCPQPFSTFTSSSELQAYLKAVTTQRRGGSLLPLALDYALHLLSQEKGRKAILLTKLTDEMCYGWDGPLPGLATEGTGYPKGDGLDVMGCAEAPFEMLNATKRDLDVFKKSGGKVLGFLKTKEETFTHLIDTQHRLDFIETTLETIFELE